MTTIPNELKITINTNIPGYQTINYKPSMTFPNDKSDNSISFNPLIKLKQSIIKSLPGEIQKKEFVNKGLFQSLINSHGLVTSKNLSQATNEGYIDNNIKVTLDTLFPTNSVIYINKQPYTIGDIQWTKGDWKIDKKINELPDLDINKITDPYLYSSIVKDEIISGEQELKNLPQQVVYGSSYVGPINVAKGVGPSASKIQQEPIQQSQQQQSQQQQEQPHQQQSQQAPQLLQPYINIKTKVVPYPYVEPVSSSTMVSEPTTKVTNVMKPYKPTPYPALPQPESETQNTPPKKPTKRVPIMDEDLVNSRVDDNSINEVKLTYSSKSSDIVRNFFLDKNFYFMVNTIFQNMNENEKRVVDKIIKETSGVDIKPTNNISSKAYTATTKGIRVNSNRGGGDCFFLAVADAINYYNKTNIDSSNKIFYNNYGKGNMIFTQQLLREIVSKYLMGLPKNNTDTLDNYLEVNVNLLNYEYQEAINNFKKNAHPPNNVITNEIFFDIINNIYYSNDNFLISKPTQMNSETIKTPFKKLNRADYINYIKSSDYWANNVAIDALCKMLGLNVITIERTTNNILRIPYVSDINSNWSRYMFIYHESNHYELMSFDYVIKTFQKEPTFSVKTQNIRKVIFDKNGNFYPPFSVIFLIFASFYVNILDPKHKQNFSLLPDILNIINQSFNKILVKNDDIELDTAADSTRDKFINLFDNTFHAFVLKKYRNNDRREIMDNFIEDYQEKGGAITNVYRQPYVSSYVNNNKNNNTSTQGESNKTNISYYITINMELHKGTTISPEERSNLKCKQRWNAVRKSYADMRGLNYVPLPDYSTISKPIQPQSISRKTNKTQKASKFKNKYNRTKRLI